ncbi:alpha/beta hydrolase [Flavobacterium sp.]
MTHSKTIVFIHGLFQNPKGWTEWKTYFEAFGYTCYSPAYPFHEGEPAELRKNINSKLGKLTLGQVTESLATFIDTLPEKPILIGHSMGGLCVQKLLFLGKGVAGICIDGVAPRGIMSFNWNFLKANLPLINPFKGDSVFTPNAEWFQQTFCNTLTLEETKIEFHKSVVPESRNIARTSIKDDGYVDFKKPHQPLLFISGAEDHLIPTSLNKKNFEAYKDKNSQKDFKIFAGRTHYICNQKNWEEVASYVKEWITNLK